MPSYFNRFLSVEPTFDIAEQPGVNIVDVMSPIDWALVEKSQALMSDQFFDELSFQIIHLQSCILAEILPRLDSDSFRRGPKLRTRLFALNFRPGHHGA